jgi:urease accessory protein
VLGERAFLEYDPEPTIFYRAAKLHTETEVHMAPGSALVLSDIFCAGRLARGERFQFALYDNRLRVYFADELIYYNRMRLEPAVQEPAKLGLFGSYSHLGTMLIVAESVDERLVAQLRTAVAVAAGDFDLQVGISLTYKHGILINVLGHHAWQIAQILAEIRIHARARLRSWGPLRLGK